MKTSLAPGSQVVTEYYEAAGLQADLDALGFRPVGYGCTTCIGNSGPLPEPIVDAIENEQAGRRRACSPATATSKAACTPNVRANYLASPPLVVAYALAGSVTNDLTKEPIGKGSDGKPVYLKDIWPTQQEVNDTVHACVTRAMFLEQVRRRLQGPAQWQAIRVDADSETYRWNSGRTYVQNPPYFEGMTAELTPVTSTCTAPASLAVLGDSITTDHISPGRHHQARPARPANICWSIGCRQDDFNSYGARRGNHEVMMRGTFANIRIKNEMVPGIEGGVTKHYPVGRGRCRSTTRR